MLHRSHISIKNKLIFFLLPTWTSMSILNMKPGRWRRIKAWCLDTSKKWELSTPSFKEEEREKGHLGSEKERRKEPIPFIPSFCLPVSLPLCLKRTDSIQSLCGRSGWAWGGPPTLLGWQVARCQQGILKFHTFATPYHRYHNFETFEDNVVQAWQPALTKQTALSLNFKPTLYI